MSKRLSFLLLPMFFMVTLAHAEDCKPSSTPGNKVICLNHGCASSKLGTTTMDGDDMNILACLYDDTGATKWKAMSEVEPTGIYSGWPDTIKCSNGMGGWFTYHIATVCTLVNNDCHPGTAHVGYYPDLPYSEGAWIFFDRLTGSFVDYSHTAVHCGTSSMQQIVDEGRAYNAFSSFTKFSP